jgi:hypothetical protein
MTRSCLKFLGIALAIGMTEASVNGQTSYPMISRVSPTAIQRGQSAEVTIGGAGSFDGATHLLFEGSGLSGEILSGEPKSAAPARKGRRNNNATVTAKISVAADAALGPRELRVATPQGVSSVGMIVVVADPVIAEGDDKANDDPTRATPISLPCVVSGAIGKIEDVDWYAFHASAGQKLAFTVWANRLEDKIHDLQTHFDPILILRDERGRELAVNDNGLFADPMLTFAFQESGNYLLEVRDTTYAGNVNWTYVLSATGGPVPLTVFPMAVNPGSRARLHALGINFDPSQIVTLDVPITSAGVIALPLPMAEGSTSPVPLVATLLSIVQETGDASAEALRGRSFAAPAALSGRLAERGDVDCYQFEAKAGAGYVFEIVARRSGSEADPVLRVLDPKGKALAEADDTAGLGKDCRLNWSAPANGLFALQVSDLHARGGEAFGYVLLVDLAKPDFTVTCDPDKLNFGPGARTSVFVKVDRRNGFTGPVSFSWEGLPPGVSASPLSVAPNLSQGEIVLSAASNAAQGGNLVSLVAKGDSGGEALSRKASPLQEIYVPGGGRALFAVSTMAVGVTAPSDITIEVDQSEIVLRPGRTAAIDVSVRRKEGFTQPVNLAIELSHLGQIYANPLPPGVKVKESGSKTLLGPKETKGKIILEASPDAAPRDPLPIAVMGHVSINFVVKTAYCSAPIMLRVER